jgi:hypothetical protein
VRQRYSEHGRCDAHLLSHEPSLRGGSLQERVDFLQLYGKVAQSGPNSVCIDGQSAFVRFRRRIRALGRRRARGGIRILVRCCALALAGAGAGGARGATELHVHDDQRAATKRVRRPLTLLHKEGAVRPFIRECAQRAFERVEVGEPERRARAWGPRR